MLRLPVGGSALEEWINDPQLGIEQWSLNGIDFDKQNGVIYTFSQNDNIEGVHVSRAQKSLPVPVHSGTRTFEMLRGIAEAVLPQAASRSCGRRLRWHKWLT